MPPTPHWQWETLGHRSFQLPPDRGARAALWVEAPTDSSLEDSSEEGEVKAVQ